MTKGQVLTEVGRLSRKVGEVFDLLLDDRTPEARAAMYDMARFDMQRVYSLILELEFDRRRALARSVDQA